MTWKDATSGHRGEPDSSARTWDFDAGPVRVTVSRHIHAAPESWFLSTFFYDFDGFELDVHGDDGGAAKFEALARVKERLELALEKVRAAMGAGR